MNNYIDLALACRAMRQLQTDDIESYGVSIPECFDANRAIKELISLPAADVVERKKGEWEKYEDFDEHGGGRHVEWTCSECFYKVKGDWEVRDSHIHEKPRENFCPNCGADMRKGGEA